MARIPCEIMAKQVLPLIRSEIARQLVHRHSLTQTEAAHRMGITQAAISWYLSHKRAILHPSLNNHPLDLTLVQNEIDDLSATLASTVKFPDKKYYKVICKICQKLKIAGESCRT
ncbi:MAG: transcriptional regulator [Candidatus Ranarchaeia archaeon]